MSLTRQLDDPTSPVRRHFTAAYPHTRDLRTATTSTAADPGQPRIFAPGPVRVLPHPETGYRWDQAGTAFDYRLRFHYAAPDLRAAGAPTGLTRVAHDGARLLHQVTATQQHRRRVDPLETGGTWTELADLVATIDLTDPALSRVCVLLCWFEQLFRTGPGGPAWTRNPVVEAGQDTPVADLLARVDDRIPADVDRLLALYTSEHPALHRPSRVVLNPTFAQSGHLGGADADLILDGTLIDLKTTKRPSLLATTLYQLLGYLLADTGDTQHIDRVAVYFARYGYLWDFTVPEFLHRLAGHPVDLAEARARFAAAIRS